MAGKDKNGETGLSFMSVERSLKQKCVFYIRKRCRIGECGTDAGNIQCRS